MANIETARTNWHNFLAQSGAIDTPAAGTFNFYIYDDYGIAMMDDTGTERPMALFTQDMFIPVTDMYPSATNGCAALAQTETATNKQNYKSLDFIDSADRYAEFALWMPLNWNGGVLQYQVAWTASGAATPGQNVIWGLQGRAYAADDAINASWGTAILVTDTLLALNDMHYSSNSADLTVAGTPAVYNGEMTLFRVYRDGDNGSDNLVGDAKLLGIRLYWTR